MYKWPLATNEFSFLDRLKICSFFLKKSNRWTQDKYVRLYEEKMAEYVDSQYAVFVSSGSSANDLIAQKIKHDLIKIGEWQKGRNQVIVGAVTWQTNVSVFIKQGFDPIFLDVNLEDFCLNYVDLEKYLKNNNSKVACVFPTAVLGFMPNVKFLKDLQELYPLINFGIDCCELTFGKYKTMYTDNNKDVYFNLCGGDHNFTTSTSCFVAHQISNGAEGGFIFTNSKDDYEYYLMARAHGLIRNLLSYKSEFICPGWGDFTFDSLYNPLVDPQFDFNILSSNYRNSEIGAYCGLLNFKHLENNRKHRIKIYNLFKDNLDPIRYYLPNEKPDREDCAFCLPIITRGEDKEGRSKKVKDYLHSHDIERRSFISGNMLRQTCYKQYGDYKKFENAEYLNNCASYIGLNKTIKEKQVLKLVNGLNKL